VANGPKTLGPAQTSAREKVKWINAWRSWFGERSGKRSITQAASSAAPVARKRRKAAKLIANKTAQLGIRLPPPHPDQRLGAAQREPLYVRPAASHDHFGGSFATTALRRPHSSGLLCAPVGQSRVDLGRSP
jgi:hypothetical protein